MNAANGLSTMVSPKLESFGMPAICDRLREGDTIDSVAKMAGVSKGTLIAWIADSADRTALAAKARSQGSVLWDERAEYGIERAPNAFELARAKELAHHYRWRASKLAPKLYGDKTYAEVNITGSVDITQHKESLRQMLDLNSVPRETITSKTVKLPDVLAHDVLLLASALTDSANSAESEASTTPTEDVLAFDDVSDVTIIEPPANRKANKPANRGAKPANKPPAIATSANSGLTEAVSTVDGPSIDEQGIDKRTAKDLAKAKRNAYMAALMRERRAKLKASTS